MALFLTEDDWQAAFGAAALMLQGAEQRGQVSFRDGATLRTVAADVATAVILAPVQDITTEPDVEVDQRRDETNSHRSYARTSLIYTGNDSRYPPANVRFDTPPYPQAQ